MSSYDPPTAEQIASLVEPIESDQLSGEETSDGAKADEPTDDKTTEGSDKTDDGGEAKGSDGAESKSDDDKAGSSGKDPDGEDAGKGEDAGTSAITLGDKEYTEAEITQIIKDNANNENWTKTNTENAQENAANADRIKEAAGFLEKLVADPEALELLQDITGLKLDDKALESIKSIKGLGESEDGAPSDIDLLRAENAILQWRQEHMGEFADQTAWDKFLTFGIEQKEPSIDKAHILWAAQGAPAKVKAAEDKQAEAESRAVTAEKAAKEAPPSPLGKGAKAFKTDFTPSQDGTYDDARKASAGMLKEVMSG